MASLVSELIVSLIDQVTRPARVVTAAMTSLRNAAAENQRRMDEMRGRMLDAAGAALALGAALAQPIKSAIALEEGLADVNKIAGMAPDGLAAFRQEILDLTKVVPMTAIELLSIAEGAAAAGTAAAELVPTTELISKAALAWGMSAEDAGENIAKIRSGLGMTIPEVAGLADVMNYLADSTAASAPDLTDFIRRVGSLGKMAGLHAKQVTAFGAAIISAGASPEVAGTGFQAMIRALTKGDAATKSQISAFDELGLSATKVSKTMQENAQATILDVLKRLRGLTADKRLSVANQLFGDEGRPVLTLIDNIDGLTTTLGNATDAMVTAGSVQAEFDARTMTTANMLRLWRNAAMRLSIAVGTALLPAIRSTTSAVIPLIDAITTFVAAHPQAVQAAVALVGGLVALRVATLATRFAFLFLKGSVLSTAIGVATAAGAIGRAGLFVLGLVNPLNLVRAAFVALRVAMLSTGIGAVIAGIAMAGMWIYNNWSGISAMFGGIADVIQNTFPALASAFSPLVDGVRTVWSWVTRLTDTLPYSEEQWRSFGVGVAQSVVAVLSDIPGTVTAVMNTMTTTARSYGARIAAAFQGWAIDFGALFGLRDNEVLMGLRNMAAYLTGFSEAVGAALVGAGSSLASFAAQMASAFADWASGKIVDLGTMLGFDPVEIEAKKSAAIAAISDLAARVGERVRAIPGEIGDWMRTLFIFDPSIGEEGFREAGRRAGEALVQAVKDAVGALVSWFSELPGRIRAAIGSIDVSSLIRWPSLPSWMGGGSPASAATKAANDNAAAATSAAAPALAGARAAGGPVVGGRTYLVGEKGRELFTPAEDGYVHDAQSTRRFSPGSAAGGQSTARVGDVNVSIDMGGVVIRNEADIDRVVSEVDRRLRDALSGLQADQSWSAA